ncbi:MAG: hypothetical protein AB8B72_13870, partial [Crocinitomicaceae bacterium]
EYPNTFDTSLKLTSDLMMVTMMHAGEAPEEILAKNWFGLFIFDDSVFTLRHVLPKIESAYDAIMDEEGGDSTGVSISINGPGTPVILFSCFQNYLSDTLLCPIPFPNEIKVNESFNFTFCGKEYRLYASGIQDPETESWAGVRNYQLFIEESTIDSESKKTLLIARAFFDETSPKILFIGDIDGDQRIDLALDVSDHYNALQPALYLSGSANIEEVVKIVGLATYTGC